MGLRVIPLPVFELPDRQCNDHRDYHQSDHTGYGNGRSLDSHDSRINDRSGNPQIHTGHEKQEPAPGSLGHGANEPGADTWGGSRHHTL